MAFFKMRLGVDKSGELVREEIPVDDSHEIEISADVVASVTLRFWLNKAQWEAMTEEQQRAHVGERIDDAATYCSNAGTIDIGYPNKLSIDITGPENADLDIQVYDPE